MSALRGPRRTSKGRMVVAAAGYALMLMAAATRRSVAAAGWLRKEGKSGAVASAFAMRLEYQ